MLARYKIHRGKLPSGEKLPDGVRQDTRKHTRHCLRPPADMVATFLADPSDVKWEAFAEAYRQVLEQRYKHDRQPFDELAELAKTHNVYLGCSCPTSKNRDVRHCHTVLALKFMKERYPQLPVKFPS
jgi:uncharacterized protein YeaO (DUF488 family)